MNMNGNDPPEIPGGPHPGPGPGRPPTPTPSAPATARPLPPRARAALEQFARWIEITQAEADAEAEADVADPTGLDDGGRPIGLSRLLEEFLALRHEVKLQTKGVRDARDEFEAAAGTLRKAIEHFESVRARDQRAIWEAGKPMAEALADLDEALERAEGVVRQARARLFEDAAARFDAALDDIFRDAPWWARKFAAKRRREVGEAARLHLFEAREQFFRALVEGFGLVVKRLARAMRAEGVRRLECVGRPVDPETMNVVEVVADPAKPPGVVVEEVRRGYAWKDRVLRVAEVRATHGPTPV